MKFLSPIVSSTGRKGSSPQDRNPDSDKKDQSSEQPRPQLQLLSGGKEEPGESLAAGMAKMLGSARLSKKEIQNDAGIRAYGKINESQGKVKLRRGVMMDKKAE